MADINTNNEIIIAKNVTKTFEIPHEKRDSIKSYFMNPFRKVRKEKFHALNDVSFTVKEGEFLGIIGRNGSGKSTLLKMLAQVFEPTSGNITINGTLVPFLELGVGFNPELTGRENIFLNGTILGMSKKYLWSKFDEIVDFAEIRDFLDLQVKNYSSGMLMRLAFSVAVQAKADIYLLDEILAVGDAGFQLKSLNKMQELLSSGATAVLVSHSIADIKKYCTRTILMNNGKMLFDGNVQEAVDMYENLLVNKNNITSTNVVETTAKKKEENQDVGNGKTSIISVELINSTGEKTNKLVSNDIYRAKVCIKANADIENPYLALSLRDNLEYNLYGIRAGSLSKTRKLPSLKAGQKLTVVFEDTMVLNPGNFFLLVQVGDYNKLIQGDTSLIMNYMSVKVITKDKSDVFGHFRSENNFKFEVTE